MLTIKNEEEFIANHKIQKNQTEDGKNTHFNIPAKVTQNALHTRSRFHQVFISSKFTVLLVQQFLI